MAKPQIRHFDVTGDSPVLVQALVVDRFGVPILQADVSSIKLRVYIGEDQQMATLDVDVATSVFDTLQTTHGWEPTDGEGFNFEHTIASDAFYRLGERMYYVEYKFTTGDTLKGPLYLRCHLTVDGVFGGVI